LHDLNSGQLVAQSRIRDHHGKPLYVSHDTVGVFYYRAQPPYSQRWKIHANGQLDPIYDAATGEPGNLIPVPEYRFDANMKWILDKDHRRLGWCPLDSSIHAPAEEFCWKGSVLYMVKNGKLRVYDFAGCRA
jgi:hypothetical protein